MTNTQTTTVSLDFVVTRHKDGTYTATDGQQYESTHYSEERARSTFNNYTRAILKAIDSGAFKEPFKPVNGMVVGDPHAAGYRAVFFGSTWLGLLGRHAQLDEHWHSTETIERLINDEGWGVIE